MNIFYLDHNQRKCAEMHLDKHVVKMIIEYAQLLSTAHRVLDGNQEIEKRYVAGSLPARWRNVKVWMHPINDLNKTLYKASHINHPSAVWVRQNVSNYMWLAEMLEELCSEYTHRYGKIHKVQSSGLMQLLKNNFPKNLPEGNFTEPTPAMPDKYKVKNDSITSYKNYYIHEKNSFAKWKNREIPSWFSEGVAYAQI